jgi:hypothetical protein
MGETVATLNPSFNGAISVEARTERLSSDGGAVLLREVLERTEIVDWLTANLTDPRDPKRVVHPLADLLRTTLLQQAQGWGDQADTEHLRDDPAFKLGTSGRRGTRPLDQDRL